MDSKWQFTLIALLSTTASFLFSTIAIRILLHRISDLGTTKTKGKEIRWAEQSRPTIGGIVLFTAWLLFVVFQYFIQNENERLSISLLIGACIVFTAGLIDDLRPMRPGIKFMCQLIAALVVVASGDGIQLVHPVVDVLITTLIFLTFMNSLNMLDNMDGVAGSVSGVILLVSGLLFGNTSLIVLSGSLLAFLVFNLKPARIYLGDSGSLFVGFLLASTAVNHLEFATLWPGSTWYYALAMIPGIFALPLADTVVVILNRLSHGISPARGGRDHTTHHLVYAGFSEKFIPLLYAVITGTGMAFVLATAWYILPEMAWSGAAASVIYFALIFFVLFAVSRKNIQKGIYVYAP